MAVIDNLKLSEEAMQAAIANFEACKSGLENAYLNISNEVRTLDASWYDEASEKFKSQFDTLYNNIKQSETVMSNVITDFKKALATYNEQEVTLTNVIQGLDTGTTYKGGAL